MKRKYVEINTFANRYTLKPITIKKNIYKIKGAWVNDGRIFIPDSARYPYNMRNTRIKTRDEKRYVLLKATSSFHYIDDIMLGMSKTSFNTLVNELVGQKLLIANHSGDKNGVNSYDTSNIADEMLKHSRREAIKELGMYVAQMGGAFTGQILAQQT